MQIHYLLGFRLQFSQKKIKIICMVFLFIYQSIGDWAAICASAKPLFHDPSYAPIYKTWIGAQVHLEFSF